MKQRKALGSGMLIAIVTAALSFGLLSWDFKQGGIIHIDQYGKAANDTTPKNRESRVRDLDEALREIEKAQVHLEKDLELQMEKVHKQMEEAMRQFDSEKLRLEIEKNIKAIDMEKIRQQIESSMKEVDFDKMKKEIEESMAKVDWNKMKIEMDKLKEIDLSQLEIDKKKMQEELKNIGPEIEKSLEKAKVELEKAKAEMKEYNDFVSQLEKDGLLNRKEGYSIRHKDGEFFINGKKQPADVYNKYRSFLEKHKNFNIKKSDDDFDVNLD